MSTKKRVSKTETPENVNSSLQAPSAAVRDVVTQDELRAVLDLMRVVDVNCVSIRKRLAAGATLQPGELTAIEDEDAIETYEDFSTSGLGNCGLNIMTSEHWERHLASRSEPRAPADPAAQKKAADLARIHYWLTHNETDLHEGDVDVLQAAINIIDREVGANSPIEEFLYNSLLSYSYDKLSSEVLEQNMRIFRQNFESMASEAAAFVKQNPQMFKDLLADFVADRF